MIPTRCELRPCRAILPRDDDNAHHEKDEYRQSLNPVDLAGQGLRRGEIAGLCWSDVDLKAKTLTIANNRVSTGSRPANPSSPRPLEHHQCDNS
jgi:integrase